MSHSRCVNGHSRSALTLLELVVVLGILAVLSTVAVRSLEPIADQARYELTQTVLTNVREAIVGEASAARTTNVCASYIGATGALPADIDDLFSKPSALQALASQSFDSDRDSVNDVTLSSGWNGPYLHLNAGASDIVDGWGNELAIATSAGDLEIASLGSDNDSVAPEDDYKANLTTTILTRDYTGEIVVRLFAIDGLNGSRIDPSPVGTEQLGVMFYGVNAAGGTTGAIEEQMLVVANSGTFEHRRTNTLCGQVAARAILWDDLDSDDSLDVGESIIKKSYVHFVFVQPSSQSRIEMELR